MGAADSTIFPSLQRLSVVWYWIHSPRKIQFYVLCSEKLNYADYIEKCIAGKEHSVTYKPHRRDEFRLSSSGETIALSFEAREFPKQPSELIFAQSLLKKICLSSLAFGIVCINKRVAYITNEVLTSRHDCVFESYTCDFELPKKAGWLQIVTRYCIVKKNLSILHVILFKEISSFVLRSSVLLYIMC